MFGKLIGKALGEIVVAPLTIASEAVKAAESAIDQAGHAIDRAYGDVQPDKRK